MKIGELTAQWLGLKEYNQALDIQQNTKIGTVLGLEHEDVLTLGVRGNPGDLIDPQTAIPVVNIRRGGQAVIHNRGQLVIYPILALKTWSISVRCYVELLMRATEKTLEDFHIKTHRKTEPGLFTERGKIAMFGIQVKKGITQHGLCINVCNDLEIFKSIRVCGTQAEPMDKLEHYHPDLDLESLFEQWFEQFAHLCHPERSEGPLSHSRIGQQVCETELSEVSHL